MNWHEAGPDGLRLLCVVQPGAASDAIVGLHDGRLRVRLQAPPADGQANARLCRFLAKQLDVPRNRVTILRGHGNRRKTVLLAGCVELPAVLAVLAQTRPRTGQGVEPGRRGKRLKARTG